MLVCQILVLLFAAGGAVWLYRYLRYEQEHTVEPPAEPITEPPYDWTPVELSLLWNWGSVRPRDMAACLLDLVRRGELKMTAEPVTVLKVAGILGVDQDYDLIIERVPGREGQLTPPDQYLVDEILFRYRDAQGRVLLTDMMIEAAREAPTAVDRVGRWREIAEAQPPPLLLEDPISEGMYRRGITIGFAMLLLGYAAAILLHSPYALLVCAIGGALIPASRLMRRRSLEAALAHSRWEAFRRHLAENSRLCEQPAQSVAIWGRHLVYAVVLGEAERVIEQFAGLLPDFGA